METSDRALIGLQMTLEAFDIKVVEHMIVKSPMPDMDLISSTVALLQLIHPMGCKFKIIKDDTGYIIRSKILSQNIMYLRSKGSRGELILAYKRSKLSDNVRKKIDHIIDTIRVPDDIPFDQKQWLFFVGFYAGLQSCASNEKIYEIMFTEYLNFVPYIMDAQEAISNIESYEV